MFNTLNIKKSHLKTLHETTKQVPEKQPSIIMRFVSSVIPTPMCLAPHASTNSPSRHIRTELVAKQAITHVHKAYSVKDDGKTSSTLSRLAHI